MGVESNLIRVKFTSLRCTPFAGGKIYHLQIFLVSISLHPPSPVTKGGGSPRVHGPSGVDTTISLVTVKM